MALSMTIKHSTRVAGCDSSSESNVESEIEENEGDNDLHESEEKMSTLTGMANVMSKILGKDIPLTKTVILAKGQTDREIRRKKVQRDGDTITEKDIQPLSEKESKDYLWETMGHKKPDALMKNYERNLQRIATRGVVQLFNAVEKQQSLVKETEKQSTGKKSKTEVQSMGSLSKGEFLDLLQGPDVEHTQAKRLKVTPAKENKPKWSVLQENFMMGGSMKDWDKMSTDDEND